MAPYVRGLTLVTIFVASLALVGCGSSSAVKLDQGFEQPDTQAADAATPDAVWSDGPQLDAPWVDTSIMPDQAAVDAPVVDWAAPDLAADSWPQVDVAPPDAALPDQGVNVDQGPPPTNDTCANAKPLTLTNGKLTLTESTFGYTNEYGTSIYCGNVSTIMYGPQLYYSLSLKANKSYRITLTNMKFPGAHVYLFTGCGAATINKDCSSAGKTGDISKPGPGGESFFFKPSADGTYYLAVDGSAPQGGPFTLAIEEFTPPTNDSCATAKPLTVPAGGKVTEKGSTLGATNEFGTGINCGMLGTTLPGAQVYYKVNMTAGKSYLIDLKPGPGLDPAFYIFQSTCTAAGINGDCGSKGSTGDIVMPSPLGNSMMFKPSTSGTYHIAVDSPNATSCGTFDLTIEDFQPATNGTCAKAAALTFSSGKATVKGTTLGVTNEFGTGISCSDPGMIFSGAQLYYSFAAKANQSYKISLLPDNYAYDLRFYVFSNTCTPATINTDCGSKGVTGDVLISPAKPPMPSSIYFKPGSAGTYKIAVDSINANFTGGFTLTVEEYTPPTNTTCAAAKALTLTSGKVSVTGDTTGQANEFGNMINCNYGPMFQGPQLYYSVALTGGKPYRLRLKPLFYARFYVFGNTCTVATINSDCGSNGATGLWATVSPGQTWSKIFTPTASGTYKIAVDSSYSSYQGSFTLDVEEFVPAANSTCAKAQTVTLSSGTTTITGDTTGATNEFGTSINCGDYKTIFQGEQVYYKASLTAGTTYTFTLTPQFQPAFIYIFSDTCTEATINADCGSSGATGAVSPGSPQPTISFKPTKSAVYKIAVDAFYGPNSYGPFTLTIK